MKKFSASAIWLARKAAEAAVAVVVTIVIYFVAQAMGVSLPVG